LHHAYLGGNYPFSAAYAYVLYHFNIRIIEPFCPYPKAEQAKHFIYITCGSPMDS